MRTTAGEQRVDVIYRRVDDEFLDPLQFRADSMLGCPGLVNAARAGNVTIANAVGNGVADDKLVYTLRARPHPVLPRRGADPAQRRHLPAARSRTPSSEVLDRLDELVVKPVDGSGGKGLVDRAAGHAEPSSTQLRERVLADPRGWIAQPVVQLSTVPTLVDDRLRPAARRPAPVRGQRRRATSGCCPAASPGWRCPRAQLVVNSSQGGGSKDTWVLAGADASVARGRAGPRHARPGARGRCRSSRPRIPAALRQPSSSTQQQQQQQQQPQQPAASSSSSGRRTAEGAAC